MLGLYDPLNTDAPPAQAYTKRLYYNVAGDVEYEARALSSRNPQEADSVWFIRKFTYDGAGNLILIQNANGSTAENCAASDRATLTYR